MTSRISLFLILLLTISCSKNSKMKSANAQVQPQAGHKWSIVIHGGAGVISKDIPDSIKKKYTNSLKEALTIGKNALANGEKGMDVVEKVINHLENDPHFNAGKGAVYTSAGTHEMDACIMDGKTMNAGAVAGVSTIKNPISLARLVMEKTPHVLLAYSGAEAFAKKMGVEQEPQSYFDTERRMEQLKRAQSKSSTLLDHAGPSVTFDEHKMGTVGCVVLDEYGNLAAGTSTGGLTNKMPGRIGDSPIVGAGTFAKNATCALSGTGIGEQYIRHSVTRSISDLMEYKGMTLQQAADQVINHVLQPGDGGIIGVSHDGSVTMTFNTQGMFRGVATSKGRFEVKIWH
jgi:beta-aspartyl-peptidase (threonine type)